MEVAIDGSDYNGRSGWAVFWGDDSPNNIYGDSPGTCAQMEVLALLKLLEQIKELKLESPIRVSCDNSYVVNGYNHWVHNWATQQWVNIVHPGLWRMIWDLKKEVGHLITLYHVQGHKGNYGNERADLLAKGKRIISAPKIPGVVAVRVQYGTKYTLPGQSGALTIYDKGTHLAQGPFWQDYIKEINKN